MNHLQWPFDEGGYLRIEWPSSMKMSLADCKDVVLILGLLIRKFRRHVKPDGIFMEVGQIKLHCRIAKR